MEPAPVKPAPAAEGPQGNALQLTLATGVFTLGFASFGSAAAMMPALKERLKLDDFQVGIAVAIPVLLGSLGRIPLGILAERFGPRLVCMAVMLGSVLPTVLMGLVSEYWQLIAVGFFLGIGLASFSPGAGLASGWYPRKRQGLALGIFGMGNGGSSLASFGAPAIAAAMGYVWGFWVFALAAFVWFVLLWSLGKDPPVHGPAKTLSDFVVLLKDRMVWVFCLYYFLTFGGLVAMAGFLPTFLTQVFGLEPTDAGFRAAGFAALATVMRPLGGAWADHIGGQKILIGVFPATAALAVLMAVAVGADDPSMVLFTIGALGMAAAIGLGNGAVFKLVPDYYPRSVASVTGLVGAAGGLGGFFPPLVLGTVRKATGAYTWGFVLLALFGLACFVTCWVTHFRHLKRQLATAAPPA
jgi:NNP family nitrate/nitrite transporter-like MFS transporter